MTEEVEATTPDIVQDFQALLQEYGLKEGKARTVARYIADTGQPDVFDEAMAIYCQLYLRVLRGRGGRGYDEDSPGEGSGSKAGVAPTTVGRRKSATSYRYVCLVAPTGDEIGGAGFHQRARGGWANAPSESVWLPL